METCDILLKLCPVQSRIIVHKIMVEMLGDLVLRKSPHVSQEANTAVIFFLFFLTCVQDIPKE